ncbi:MAG: cell division FtsA domain-containing protein, partial [Chloroflexota bacterium]
PIHLSSENGVSNYRRAELCTIIEARVEEIFLMVKDVLRASDALGKLPAGAVITGGTAQMQGITDLAAAILDMPVRVGVPLELEGLVDTITGPAYANAVGLVRWGLTYASAASTSFETHAPRSHDNFGRAMHWLRSFLP